jgi:hypothetical protein
MPKVAGIFAVLLAFLFAGLMSAPALAAEKSATLRLINPEIFLKGMRIKHIVATLDGASFGDCWGDRRASLAMSASSRSRSRPARIFSSFSSILSPPPISNPWTSSRPA